MASISTQVAESLKVQIDEATSDPDGVPGTVFCAINKDGDFIFQHASGYLGIGVPKPVALDSVFWIASCTKLITGIACMQLVEQGKLVLDDVDFVEKIAPELKDVKVLTDGKLVEKEREISLRMLLNHTAGFGYSFFQKRLNNFFLPGGVDEFSGLKEDTMRQPLVNQPGSRWEYGINVDWAGIIVERVTGMSLDEYFHKNIFAPLGIKDITFNPTSAMKDRLMFMHARSSSGELRLSEDGHLLRRPLRDLDDDDRARTFQAGGAGCFGTVPDYCQVLATLLNGGTHPKTGATVLRPETVNEMFHNQIPSFPEFARQGIFTAKPAQSNDVPNLYSLDEKPAGWGLTFYIHLHDVEFTGRSAGSVWWAGLPNLYWWIDRKRGIAGMIGSQILPFVDPRVTLLWAETEKGIYENLK